MNELATTASGSHALAIPETELIDTLRNSLFPGATDNSIRMVVAWCKATGKDPMKKPCHIVPMSVKKPGTRDQYEWRDVIMPGIVDYRTDAARTGLYAGTDEAKFGPDVTRNLGGEEITFPEWCEFTVYRLVAGQRCPFSSGRVRWLESYATAGRDTAKPNAMWKKRPYGQLEKCAEAMALRRAFPEVGAAPAAEEMIGRTFDDDTIDAATGAPASSSASSGPTVARRTRPAPAAEDATIVGEQRTATPAPPAAAPAQTPPPPPPPPPPAQAGEAAAKFVGAGEQAFLRNKAKTVGKDLDVLLKEAGGLVIDRLTPEDFAELKSTLRALEG